MSTGQTPHGSRTKHIGVAILKVLAENALKNIPVYGFYIGVGIDILKEVKAEIDKDRPLTKEEMIASLRLLTPSEVEKITDAVLRSPTGVQATASLPPAEREAVRQQLKNLPSEFEQILAEIEDRENKESERAVQDEQRRRDEEFMNLQNRLKAQLRDNNLKAAHETVEQILKIKPHDPEALRIEAFINKRISKPTPESGCLWVFAEACVIVLVLLILHVNTEVFDIIAISSVALLLLIHLVIAPKLWPVLPRDIRKFIGVIAVGIITIIVIFGLLVAFGHLS